MSYFTSDLQGNLILGIANTFVGITVGSANTTQTVYNDMKSDERSYTTQYPPQRKNEPFADTLSQSILNLLYQEVSLKAVKSDNPWSVNESREEHNARIFDNLSSIWERRSFDDASPSSSQTNSIASQEHEINYPRPNSAQYYDTRDKTTNFIDSLAPGTVTASKLFCIFCKNNGEPANWYMTHKLKNQQGQILCPVLRKYVCPVCQASGDKAHTVTYCPKRKRAARQWAIMKCSKTNT